MKKTVKIRDCEHDDLPAVMDLMTQLLEVATPPAALLAPGDAEKLFGEMQAQPAVYLNLVAEVDEQVVAFASAVSYRTLFHKGGTMLINELVVERSWRGDGIGSAMIERIQEEARARGMDEVEVGTERHNQPAQRFYRRCGFDQQYVLLGMELDV